MESEEFVANEYVAACWGVVCLGQKQDRWHISSDLYIAEDGLHDEHGVLFKGLQTEPSTARHNIYNRGDDTRWWPRNDSPQGYTYNGVAHWGVTTKDFTTEEHPNASV